MFFLRVERFLQPNQEETAAASELSSLGRISNRATGRVLAELLPQARLLLAAKAADGDRSATRHPLCLLLEDEASAQEASSAIRMFVPPQPVQEALAAVAANSSANSVDVVLRSSAGAIDGLASPLALVHVLQHLLNALEGGASAYCSQPPLAVRVALRQRILERYAFAELPHEIARSPTILHVIASFDPAHVPRGSRPGAP